MEKQNSNGESGEKSVSMSRISGRDDRREAFITRVGWENTRSRLRLFSLFIRINRWTSSIHLTMDKTRKKTSSNQLTKEWFFFRVCLGQPELNKFMKCKQHCNIYSWWVLRWGAYFSRVPQWISINLPRWLCKRRSIFNKSREMFKFYLANFFA